MKKLLIVVAFLATISGCTQSGAPADPSVITSRSEAWEDALNAKDIDTLVEIYSSDARVMAPNDETQRGSDAVRAAFGAMIDAGLSGDLTSVDSVVVGDIGYNVGTYELRAGGDTVDTGKFIETWGRGDDGKWRITNDIWNSNAAPEDAGDENTHLVILHEVDDVDHWLAAWRGEDSRHHLFKDNGAEHVHTFRSPDSPNLTGLVISVHDMGALQAMIESDEGQAAAAEDGVRMNTMTVLTEAD